MKATNTGAQNSQTLWTPILRHCLTQNRLKLRQLNNIQFHFSPDVSNCLKLSHGADPNCSFFANLTARPVSRHCEIGHCLTPRPVRRKLRAFPIFGSRVQSNCKSGLALWSFSC